MVRERRLERLAAVASLAAWLAGDARADVARTLHRLHDPVIVSTARLAELPTRDTRDVLLYRIDAGRAVPIPFQFDARDREGEVEVDGPRDFVFDANDELVFMAKDAGDRTDARPWPDGWDAAVEIEVIDPRPADGGRAWAYLVHFRKAPVRPTFEPYVTFDTVAQRARSAAYQVDYAPTRNFFTGVRLPDALGHPGPNLLRQTRMRGSPTFSLLFQDVTLDFTEENSIVAVEGVRVGPVRAVRRARLSVDLGPLFPDLPGGTAYTYHYRTAYLTPSRVGFSWLILKALRDFRFENVLEFVSAAMPLTYFDRTHPAGVAVDKLGPTEVRTTEDQEWWAHTSEAGTMLHAFVIPPRWREWGVTRGTVVRGEGEAEGARAPTAPSTWAAGYTLQHMTQLREAGSWDLMMASIVLPTAFRAGDEEEPMALVRAPLATEVRVVR